MSRSNTCHDGRAARLEDSRATSLAICAYSCPSPLSGCSLPQAGDESRLITSAVASGLTEAIPDRRIRCMIERITLYLIVRCYSSAVLSDSGRVVADAYMTPRSCTSGGDSTRTSQAAFCRIRSRKRRFRPGCIPNAHPAQAGCAFVFAGEEEAFLYPFEQPCCNVVRDLTTEHFWLSVRNGREIHLSWRIQ